MKNKILVEIIIPELDETYNLLLPINKKVGNILELLNKSIIDLTNGSYVPNSKAVFYNRETGNSYESNVLIKDTDIRNGTMLILL